MYWSAIKFILYIIKYDHILNYESKLKVWIGCGSSNEIWYLQINKDGSAETINDYVRMTNGDTCSLYIAAHSSWNWFLPFFHDAQVVPNLLNSKLLSMKKIVIYTLVIYPPHLFDWCKKFRDVYNVYNFHNFPWNHILITVYFIGFQKNGSITV